MQTISSESLAQFSTLSNIAYSSNIPKSLFGWNLVKEFSQNFESGLSISTFKSGDDIVVSFRGTDGINDLGTDSSFVTGRWSSQFEDAAAFFDGIRKQFPSKRIIVVGHSLGGGIAQLISNMFHVNGVSFDAPGALKITESAGYRAAEAAYASDVDKSQPVTLLNYTSNGSLISGVGSHIGEVVNIDPIGGSGTVLSVVSFFALFVGGPVSFLALGGLGLGNILRLHGIEGTERAFWAKVLLEKELSADLGSLTQIKTRRSDVPELLALGGSPNDEVTVFKDRYTGETRATLTRESGIYVLRSGDMRERITLLKAADGAFDCLIEVRDQSPVSCRLRYGPDNQPRVEIDRNGDGKPEQIVESGRDGSGAVFEKTSYVDGEGRLTSSQQETLSDDGLKKQVLCDLNGDGVIEERRSFVSDELGNEVISAQTLKDDGQVSSELLIRSDTGRQLSFYELIVNGKTENLGFISQPVDDELIARLSQRLGVTNNLRDTYAYGGVLTDTITLSARDNQTIAHELSARFIDAQLQSFDERSAYPGLEGAPSLLSSKLVQEKILAELAQFSDRAVIDVRFNLDNELMLVGSRRMVLVRADGSVRRQLVEAGGAQTVEELDADGVLRSTFTAKSLVDMPGAARVTYAFKYRDGTSADIDTRVFPGLPQQTSLRLRSGTFNIDAVYDDGQLQGIQRAVINGRELSPGARAALSKQLADMSADELHAAFLDMQAQGKTPEAAEGAAPKLGVTLEDARRELIATTDNLGNPLYVNRQERQLQALGDRVSTLIDGLTLLRSLKTG